MELDQFKKIDSRIHEDEPIIYPSVIYIQHLLCSIEPTLDGDEAPFDKLINFAITELKIIQLIEWSYNSGIFNELISLFENFIDYHDFDMNKQVKDIFRECIALLRFLSVSPENLDVFPSGYEGLDTREMLIRANVMQQVQKKFDNPNIKCPYCRNEFSQVAFEVTRTLYAVKCPKCNQSISH